MSLHSVLVLSALVACAPEPDATDPDPPVDTIDDPIDDDVDLTPPTVLSISPEDNSRGVRDDVEVVIRFSEAMDTESVERSLDTRSLGDVGLSWSEGRDELLIAPQRFLEYAWGEGFDPSRVTPRRYSVVLGTGATDEAGNPIVAGAQTVFDTLKSMVSVCGRDNALTGTVTPAGQVSDEDDYLVVGDDALDIAYRSFVSIDLSELPEETVEVTDAILRAVQLTDAVGTPYRELGRSVLLDHAAFDDLDVDAFAGVPLAEIGPFAGAGDTGVSKTVTAAVAEDFARRTERSDLSQFRLRFSETSNGDRAADAVVFGREEFSLRVTWLVP